MNSEEQQPTTAHSFTNYVASTIDPQDPWKDDKLKRKESSELLTKLLNNAHTPFTLVVNSPWGTGKTFFIERWHAAIGQEHFAFYFSAWEAEIHPIPMLAFLQGLQDTFDNDKELSCVTDDMTALIMKFIAFKVALPLAIDALVPGVGASIAGANIINQIVETGKSAAKAKLEEAFKEPPASVQNIRESFKSIIDKVVAESSKQKPIYIFIDELDRCRPDFAIRFLEELKHIFCVSDIVFVLSLDLRQLETSIKHVYGADIQCEGYLRRFVNQFYSLPPIPFPEFASLLFTKHPISNREAFIAGRETSWDRFFAIFAGSFKASLRDMECIYARFYAICQIAQPKTVFPLSLLYLLFVKTIHPNIWEIARTGEHNTIMPYTLAANRQIIMWDKIGESIDEEIMAACMGNKLKMPSHQSIMLPTRNSPAISKPTALPETHIYNLGALGNQVELVELYSNAFDYVSD